MNWSTRFTVLFSLIAIGLHAYLATHFYTVHFGVGSGSAFCNVNQFLNCDTTSASSFAAWFGIPIAAWGGAFQLVLLSLVLAGGLGLVSDPARAIRMAFWMSIMSASVSVAMLVISLTLLNSVCLFCGGVYLISFLLPFSIFRQMEERPWGHLTSDLGGLLTAQRSYLFTIAIGVPALAGLTHLSLMRSFNIQSVDKVVQASLLDWRANPVVKFDLEPSLALGPSREEARAVIVEFADFLCVHCQLAATPIKAFVRANPDVRLEFYNFPLDGACNPEVPQARGTSCQIAKTVHCAGKIGDGWLLWEKAFEAQESLARKASAKEIDAALRPIGEALGFDWAQIESCVADEATQTVMQQQAKLAVAAQLQGTPTIYFAGRKLPRGSLIPVLNGAKLALPNP